MPLRRAWCLWEIYSTLSEEAQLSVCMSDLQNADFRRALVEDFVSPQVHTLYVPLTALDRKFRHAAVLKVPNSAAIAQDSIIRSLCTIDAETAEAGSQNDLEMIFAAVRTLDGGFHTLNAVVLGRMREWLIESMITMLSTFGLRFEPKPPRYRICCSASGERETWGNECVDLFESGCNCDDDEEDTGRDDRLEFGNWYRTGAGTPGDLHICSEHYNELSRMQKRKWSAINCVADLGADGANFKVQEYELIGEPQGDATAANAASLLLYSCRLLSELNQLDNVAWDVQQSTSKALEIRLQVRSKSGDSYAIGRVWVAILDTMS
eukprot:SAG11_NODE_1359_length_5116_cov_11.562687_4_plen_322_part_00